MPSDLAAFRHTHETRVRSFHVDFQNIVHNVWYFFIFEEARVEFIRSLGMSMEPENFVTDPLFYIARNSCDYFASARFDDPLRIYSRVEFVRNSSAGFEQVMMNLRSGELVACATQVIVHVDKSTGRPGRIPDDVRAKILSHEGENVTFGE